MPPYEMTYAAARKRPDWSEPLNRTTVMLAAAAGLLAGCSTIPDAPTEVRIPVPVPCVEQLPVRPSMMSDSELLALDDFGLVVALARDRRIRQGYIAELEATLEGCK